MTAPRVTFSSGGLFIIGLAVQVMLCSGRATEAIAQCPSVGWIPMPFVSADYVRALVVWDVDGPGPQAPVLVVGGEFTSFGGVSVHGVATYDLDSGAISNLGGGISGGQSRVDALAVDRAGNLLVGGAFTRAGTLLANSIARWNGSTWSTLGEGPGGGEVFAITVLSNNDIIVGTLSGGAISAARRWDGSTWSNFGGLVSPRINSLLLRPDGVLFAGSLQSENGHPLNQAARWSGSQWLALGSGVNGDVNALAALPNGEVIAGGNFGTAGGIPSPGIARWDGANWHALGAGLGTFATGGVLTVTTLPDGQIVAGGLFNHSGATSLNNLALWRGVEWLSLGAGTDGGIQASTLLPNGDLVIGGSFMHAGGVSGSGPRLARYRLGVLRADLNCDGRVNNFDIDAFVLAITDPEQYATNYPACDVRAADINCDSNINSFDIDPFVTCLARGGCP